MFTVEYTLILTRLFYSLKDYAFLAGAAYVDDEYIQAELNAWFGPGVVIPRADLVELWRTNVTSAVSFKLVTYPVAGVGDFAYVLIRGTKNPWDALTDMQLWSPAALFQVLRAMLPFGQIWDPVIPSLINLISKLESSSMSKISFYKDTTAFVLKVKAANFSGVAITGHSLGGGLSIITGAQTGTPAVALSGPNAMLSRLSFDPPLTVEALNSKTFNIIPHRDLVPMIDDPAQNSQGIRCTTKQQDVVGCHTATRSLCEIIYTCGSRTRPVLCECVTHFGYPEPTPSGNRTFAQACGL
jgi:lipase ATG15